jgi:hypothetical protein
MAAKLLLNCGNMSLFCNTLRQVIASIAYLANYPSYLCTARQQQMYALACSCQLDISCVVACTTDADLRMLGTRYAPGARPKHQLEVQSISGHGHTTTQMETCRAMSANWYCSRTHKEEST